MKAEQRCKAHFLGDKCRGELNHDSHILMKSQPNHFGVNVAWKGENGDLDRTVLARSYEPKAPKRNRMMNRFVRNLRTFNPRSLHGESKSQMIRTMTIVERFFKGGKRVDNT